MTFAEELKNISDIVNFEINIANECAIIKDEMRKAASLGIRGFQIDIVKLFSNSVFASDISADNYHVIITAKDIPITNYKDKIVEYLEQQGFSKHNIDIANITNSHHCSRLISVRW